MPMVQVKDVLGHSALRADQLDLKRIDPKGLRHPPNNGMNFLVRLGESKCINGGACQIKIPLAVFAFCPKSGAHIEAFARHFLNQLPAVGNLGIYQRFLIHGKTPFFEFVIASKRICAWCLVFDT
jgi:hypothetical protein